MRALCRRTLMRPVARVVARAAVGTGFVRRAVVPSRALARVRVPVAVVGSRALSTAGATGSSGTGGDRLQQPSITLQELEAEAGPPRNSREAQFLLALLYLKGQGDIPRDVKQSVRWMSLAAANGCVPAQTKLANLSLAGYGVPQNAAEAARLYALAAEAGDPEAQGALAYMYQIGTGVKQDMAAAAKWFARAADGGHVRSQTAIGFLLLHGVGGVARDVPRALEYLEAAANAGHAEAQTIVGVLYTAGGAVAPDPKKAHDFLTRAAEAGDKDAQANLGDLYLWGNFEAEPGAGRTAAEDVEWALKQAVRWYGRAADQGVARSQCALGLMYFHGLGVARDLEAATKWLGNAANAGLVDAAFMMGVLCASTLPGAAAPANLPKAKDWFKQLSEQLKTQKPYHQTSRPATGAAAAGPANTSALPSSHSSEAEARARGHYQPFVIAGVERLVADPVASVALIHDWQKRKRVYWHGGLEALFQPNA